MQSEFGKQSLILSSLPSEYRYHGIPRRPALSDKRQGRNSQDAKSQSAITSGSYAGSLNIAGVLQAGLQKLTRHGGTGGSKSCSVSHPTSQVVSCIMKSWQPGDKLWIKAPAIRPGSIGRPARLRSQLPLLPLAAVPGRVGGTAAGGRA